MDEVAGGVFFVSLAEVDDASLVVSSIARAIGLHEQPGLTLEGTLDAYLAEREVLLVLDNLEQILDAAADVSRLARQAGGVRIVTTSREPLRVDGEEVVEVQPLSLPQGNAPEQSDAVQLFVNRASSSLSLIHISEPTRP